MTHAETVAEILDAARIRLKSHAAGHTEHVRCSKCDGGRTREVSLSVTVDADGRGVTWTCHRGGCGFSGGERIASAPPPRPERRGFQTPPPAAEAEAKNEPDWMVEFFFERKIGTKAFRRLGIYGTERTFPHPTGKTRTIVFPYRYRGEVVNRKYRPFPAKNPMLQEKNALPTLFNVDSLGDNPEEIIFCEGEMDIAAMVECGIFHAVTLKDGAPAKVGEINPDAPRFEALKTHADMLAKAKRIVLAGDSDAPGLALREHLARRLGRHRCHLVTWPEDCKDAGDVLRLHGPEAVLDGLRAAAPYPIDGLQRIEEGTLMALRALPPPRTMGTGARATDGILKLPTEGRLIIVTGYPGGGKAMALDTPVPTPTGWTTMGELKDGDLVYSRDGEVTRVTRAHPVMYDRECYQLTFNDGASFVCDAGHLWLTHTAAARLSERHQKTGRGERNECLLRGTDQRHLRVLPKVVTTRQIAESLTINDGPASPPRLNHSIPVAEALVGCEQWPLSIPPYTLGAWLGDGSSENGNFFSADLEVIENIRADGYEVTKQACHALNWGIQNFKQQLRLYNLRLNKHIPEECLHAPAEDRMALLQGLMDTDGYASPDGRAEFCSIKRHLAESVLELVRGLGMKASLLTGRATIDGRDCGEKYRVCFTAIKPVFRLRRKLERFAGANRLGSRCAMRTITSVVPVDSVPVRCITVDHPSGLYLVGRELVPTHNTNWVRFVMIHTIGNHNRRWAVFSPEMQPWQMFAAECAEVWSGKPFYPIGGIPAMSREDVADAERWLKDRVTMLVCDAGSHAPTLDWVIERGMYSVLRDGTTDLWIDPWNQLDHSRKPGITETDYIGQSLQRLSAFGLRYGCNVWINAHPAKPMPTKDSQGKSAAPGPYDISGSSHWFNRADMGITVHKPGPDRAEIHLWKSRYVKWWGKSPAVASLDFDPLIGRYSTPIETYEPASHWQEKDV